MFSGSDVSIAGLVHTNSSAEVSGSDNSFDGGLAYGCSFSDGGSGNVYTPPAAPRVNVTSPINFAFTDFPCTYTYAGDTDLASRPEVWVGGDPSSNQLLTGVYCSQQDIILSGSDVTGEVTLVALDEVKLSGSNFHLTGHFEDVLAFSAASHDSAIDLSGSGGTWAGYIYAPNGRVKVAGSNNLTLEASIIADRVSVSGSDFSLDSESLLGWWYVALIE